MKWNLKLFLPFALLIKYSFLCSDSKERSKGKGNPPTEPLGSTSAVNDFVNSMSRGGGFEELAPLGLFNNSNESQLFSPPLLDPFQFPPPFGTFPGLMIVI